jgi:hypothetical protein
MRTFILYNKALKLLLEIGRFPPVSQKTANCVVKGHQSQAKMPPFALRKAAFGKVSDYQ